MQVTQVALLLHSRQDLLQAMQEPLNSY